MSDQSASATDLPVFQMFVPPQMQMQIHPDVLMQAQQYIQMHPDILMQAQQEMLRNPELLIQAQLQLQMHPEMLMQIQQNLQMHPELLMHVQQQQQMLPELQSLVIQSQQQIQTRMQQQLQMHALMLMSTLLPPPICTIPELWHPDHIKGILDQPSKQCVERFTSDIRRLLKNPQPNAHVFPDENDVTLVELLLIGSSGTPYEGGFFHFSVRAMPDYPSNPPRVAFRTASPTGLVRFNPNFYENGCVCLSILGTWHGSDTWQESYRLENLVHALQFRLDHRPLYNEPLLLSSPDLPKKSQRYNDQIAYETLRVSVCEQLERRSLPSALHRCAAAHFASSYPAYQSRCAELKKRLDGKSVKNVYHEPAFKDTFEFSAVSRRMEKLLPTAQLDAEASDE